LAVDARNVSTPGAAGLAEIRGRETRARELRDRGIKDPRTAAAQNAKLGHTENANPADGLSKSIAANGKDVAGVSLSAHPDSHAKAAPPKPSGPALSSQIAVADTDGPDEAPTSLPSPITTAKLVQNIGQSEFRVGMQTQEFGSIDIRTSVARHMFSAQISVEHGDVAKSMTADLPALYHRLADQQVAVTSIVIQDQGFATSSGLAQDAQPRNWQGQSHGAAKSEAEPVLPIVMEAPAPAGRLDIRI
jgi:flagellar hook-length control protein FliK